MKPNKDLKQLSARVKYFREKKGWSQAELANRMGRDKQWIQRVENGTTNIKFTSICRIAKCLDIPVSKLTDIK
jgi:transcriptional regulator with XRE-family HTH domain